MKDYKLKTFDKERYTMDIIEDPEEDNFIPGIPFNFAIKLLKLIHIRSGKGIEGVKECFGKADLKFGDGEDPLAEDFINYMDKNWDNIEPVSRKEVIEYFSKYPEFIHLRTAESYKKTKLFILTKYNPE